MDAGHPGQAPDEDEKPVVVLFDMDGTLADYVGELFRRLECLRSPGEPEINAENYGAVEVPGYVRERMRMIKCNAGFWINLPPLAAGFEIMEEARRHGCQIEVLTKGSRATPIAWMEKLQWCERHLGDDPYHVTITEDKGLVYGRLLVDDAPEYILRWLRWRKRGTVIMPDQPWNRGFEHPQVHRYDGDRAGMAAIVAHVVEAARSGEPPRWRRT